MRSLPPIIAVLLALWAGVAHAVPVRMGVRDVPLPVSPRSLAAATPRFNLVGLHWQGAGTPWYRTRGLGGRWSAWRPADDDWGRIGVWRKGNPDWTGASDAIQLRTVGRVTRLREYLLWSPPVRLAARRLQLAGAPTIIPRSGWQADESIRRAAPTYSPALQLAVVHHTVNTNNYTCDQSAAIVRGIEVYHVKGNGWNDMGYNFLVDRCGQVFEGRYGGVDRNVVGAHSLGFNRASVGVALVGTYESVKPAAVQQKALADLLAWRLDVAHVNPVATVDYVSGGNGKYRAGTIVKLGAISGHRDTYATDCPGGALYALLPSIAAEAAGTGLPKLYLPVVSGSLEGPVRFTARLSTSLPWTVTVVDGSGATVASGSGTGTIVDWTWDASGALPNAYTWTISAGPSVRPATGSIGTVSTALTLSKPTATPSTLDGTVNVSATIAYTLNAAANVTGELLNSVGTAVEQLFVADEPAGPQSFVFTPTGVPDGNYTVRLTARDAAGHLVQATVPVIVSRTVLGFTVDTPLVSPNGDGRRDTAAFGVMLAQSADVSLSLVAGTTSTLIFSGYLAAGAQQVNFTGSSTDGTKVLDGAYTATLTFGTPPLALTLTRPLAIDTVPPTLSLVSVSPLRLRTDEQANVFAWVNGRLVRTTAKPGAFRVGPNVTVKTLRAVVRDAAGNQSAWLTYRRP